MKTLQRQGGRFKGCTIGLDLHQSFIQVVVLDKRGEEAFAGRIEAKQMQVDLKALLVRWKDGGVQVVFEACGMMHWVFDLCVQVLGREAVHVAHPGKLRVIAVSGAKNDHNDAWWLAYMLYERRLPEAYVAEGALRDLKEASRELRYYVDLRSDLIRRVRSKLKQLGLKLPANWHTSEEKRSTSNAVIESVAGVAGQALRDLKKQIESLSETICAWRKKVEELGALFPEIATMRAEIPGMQAVVAGLVYGELGSPKRFRKAKAYASATGLPPEFHESGGKAQQRGISRRGSRLARWGFTRAALACLRCKKGSGAQVRQWIEGRLKRQKAKPKVLVAAARKLAEGVWRLIAWGEAFDLKRAFPT